MDPEISGFFELIGVIFAIGFAIFVAWVILYCGIYESIKGYKWAPKSFAAFLANCAIYSTMIIIALTGIKYLHTEIKSPTASASLELSNVKLSSSTEGASISGNCETRKDNENRIHYDSN